MSDPIHQLWLYNNWANELILNSFKQNTDTIPASCLRLFSHITNAQLIWLSRINGEPSPVGVWDEQSLAECEKNHHIFTSGVEPEIADVRKGKIASITYTTTKGVIFTDSSMDILLHTFNHGTYHRAQIAQEMRRNGLEPINTDFILFKRLRP